MRKTFLALTVISTLFASPLFAGDQPGLANPKPIVCDPVDQENVLTKGISESPDLLVAVLEGERLGEFWQKLREAHMMGGPPLYNKVYIFKSENHPDSVYVFFLADGCIGNVQLTYKALIEQFLEGIIP